MIEIDGLKIEHNQYGQVVVTHPNGSTTIDGSVQALLLYEILARNVGEASTVIEFAERSASLPGIGFGAIKKGKRGRAKA
jgi:hypothetical protein